MTLCQIHSSKKVNMSEEELKVNSNEEDPSQPPRDSLPPKRLTWLKVAFICFVLTSGGPFGVESVVRNGGPGFAFIAVIGTVVLCVVPVVLVVSELTAMMPSNHGFVEYVDHAFGPEVAFVSSMLQIISFAVDLAVYPVLVASYFSAVVTLPNEGCEYAVSLAFLILGSVPAFFSVNDIGSMAGVLLLLICCPFGVGVIAGLKGIDPNSWIQFKSPSNVASLASVSVWLYTGFMSLGNLGGEVESPKTVVIGALTAAFFDMMMYLLPLSVALQVKGQWSDGFFSTAFDQILPGLGWAISATGALSAFALFSSSLTCYGRSLWGVADKGWLPRQIAAVSNRGCPYVANLMYIGIASLLILFNFDFLVTVELVISSSNFVLFYSSFICLRYKLPSHLRPWKVPGGKLLPWLVITPPTLVFFALFASGIVEWKIAVAVGLAIALLFGVFHGFVKKSIRARRIADLEATLAEGC